MSSPKIEVEISSSKDLEPPSTYAATDLVAETLRQIAYQQDCCVDLRFCSEAEVKDANQQFRGKPTATNVLSFPNVTEDGEPDDWLQLVEEGLHELGTIMMCLPVIQQESQTYGISVEQRLAHLTVHATLHLLGYTHDTPQSATEMETLESQILQSLNYNDPWTENE